MVARPPVSCSRLPGLCGCALRMAAWIATIQAVVKGFLARLRGRSHSPADSKQLQHSSLPLIFPLDNAKALAYLYRWRARKGGRAMRLTERVRWLLELWFLVVAW